MRLLFAALLPCRRRVAAAQPYPARTIRIIVPATPGGAIDLIARMLADKMTASLGQPVVVENKPGASNNLGTDFVAKSPPDGYTLVIVASSHATNKHLFKTLPYDPVKDFEPVVYTHVVPLLLAVHPSVPAKTVPELIAWMKANPDKAIYAHQRNRQLAAHGGRALHEHERHQDAARALQGQLRRASRPARRPHGDDLRHRSPRSART